MQHQQTCTKPISNKPVVVKVDEKREELFQRGLQ